MIESGYTKAIHNKLAKDVHAWKIIDHFEGGVPDACYMLDGTENGSAYPVWAEYKLLADLPKRSDTLILPKLSELQKRWLNRCYNMGHPTLVIIGCQTLKNAKGIMSVVFERPEEWEAGCTVQEFRKMAETNCYTTVANLIRKRLHSRSQM